VSRRADQRLHLPQRMHGGLEHDVARLAEHPVRVVAGVELCQGHTERDLHVLDAPDLARGDALEQPRERRMVDVVVVRSNGEPEGLRLLV